MSDESTDANQPDGQDVPETPDAPAEQKDWEGELAAQKKINRSLESRGRKDLAAIEALKAELDKLRAGNAEASKIDPDKIRKEVESEATERANQRIVRAEGKALAVGLLIAPSDAPRYLNLSDYEVDEDGNVDPDAVKADLQELLKSKPHLAAQGGRRFTGGADGGPRGTGKPDPGPGIARLTSAYAQTK